MMQRHLILRSAAALLAPAIILFAFYIQFHGDYGPGGGFQAGVVFSTAFILYALVFGLLSAQIMAPIPFLRFALAAGALLYGGTGLASLLFGAAFLDYAPFAHDPQAGRHIGIFLVELGVGICVAAAMCLIFAAFSAYSTQIKDEDW